MNFLDGRLLAAATAPTCRARCCSFDRAGLDARDPGAAVTVCLRPEDVVVRDVGEHDRQRLDATVGVMEFIGNHFATTLHVLGHRA